MILIADCGSTSIKWALVRDGAESAEKISTPGINAALADASHIKTRFAREIGHLAASVAPGVEAVHFYGAGCLSADTRSKVSAALAPLFTRAAISVDSDMLGAARGLCGARPGIACILGTGSNACYFDGEKISDSVPPLGFILGDEGSGAALGKALIGSVLKRQLPADVRQEFASEFGLDAPAIIERVYRQPEANRFLASFAPFVLARMHRAEVRQMAIEAFSQFFRRNVAPCAIHAPGAPVNFTGSIAFHFREALQEAASGCGFSLGKVEDTPLDGLIAYHINNHMP